jgi:hypothetical protein
MLMRKCALLAFILLAFLPIGGCKPNFTTSPTTESSTMASTATTAPVTTTETSKPTVPAENGIPHFSEDELIFNCESFTLGVDSGIHATAGFRMDEYDAIVQAFPNPLLRKIGDYFYIVYDTENKTRLYIFCSESKSHPTFFDGFPIIMKKTFSYQDFSKLRVGSNLNDVANIDSCILLYKRQFDSLSVALIDRAKERGIYLTSMHLLTDGILQIIYEKHEDSYLITKITYRNDFTLDGLFGKTTYKIYAEDYIN